MVNRHSISATMLLALYAAAIISFVYIGTFSRIISDDYCTAADAIQTDAWTATRDWYMKWSGLYSNFYIRSVLAPYQPDIHPYMTPIFVLLTWSLLVTLFYRSFVLIQLRKPLLSAISLSFLTMFLLLHNSPTPQSLYWMAAMVAYAFPVVFLLANANLALSLWNQRGPVRYIIMTVMAVFIFITGGFSETYAALQVTALILLLTAVRWYVPSQNRKEWLLIILAFLLVAIISLIILAVSPGSHFRRDTGDISITIPDLIFRTFVYTVLVFAFESYGFSIAGLLFMFLAVIVGLFWLYAPPRRDLMKSLPYPQRPWLFAFIAGVVVFIMVAAVIAPMIYATRGLTLRALYGASFLRIGLFLLWGYLAAVGLARAEFPGALISRPIYRLVRAAVLILLIFMPLQTLVVNADLAESLRVYATEWDERHEMILAAQASGQSRIDVPPLSYDFERYINVANFTSEENANWVNVCVSSYYGLQVFIDEN